MERWEVVVMLVVLVGGRVGERSWKPSHGFGGLGLGLNVKGLLESPLPRPYIIDDNGEVVPETTDVEIVGSGVQVERITTASQVMQVRLYEEVHTPLRQWLLAFDTTKVFGEVKW